MIYTHYETVYILKPELAEDVVRATNEKVSGIIESNGGRLVRIEDWGKRKLAYAVRKSARGHYVLVSYAAPGALVAELERLLRIDDNLLRFLTIQVAVDVDPEVLIATSATMPSKVPVALYDDAPDEEDEQDEQE